jgi:prolipoprotein diacylglyceryltransferase
MSRRVVINAPSPWIGGATRRRPAYRVCGEVGLAVGLLLAELVTIDLGRSPLVMAALAAVGVCTFVVLARWTRALTGEERLVYYHHEVAILAVGAAVLAISGRPVLGYLDTLALGIGVVLALGRIGCTMAGCCHGKPARAGIRYGLAHVANGLDARYIGIPLLPVQLAEAGLVLALVAAGTAEITSGAPAGTALVTYVSGYSALRFALEFARGDSVRGRLRGGLSVPQWWSVTLTALTTTASLTGLVPTPGGSIDLAIALFAAALITVAFRRGPYGHRRAQPAHRPEAGRSDARHVETAGPAAPATTYDARRT